MACLPPRKCRYSRCPRGQCEYRLESAATLEPQPAPDADWGMCVPQRVAWELAAWHGLANDLRATLAPHLPGLPRQPLSPTTLQLRVLHPCRAQLLSASRPNHQRAYGPLTVTPRPKLKAFSRPPPHETVEPCRRLEAHRVGIILDPAERGEAPSGPDGNQPLTPGATSILRIGASAPHLRAISCPRRLVDGVRAR